MHTITASLESQKKTLGEKKGRIEDRSEQATRLTRAPEEPTLELDGYDELPFTD